jgi:hypothetical protein
MSWALTEKRPRSISGVELDGDRMARDIYLDESGISGSEPIAVVAGVIIQRDVHWLPVQEYIDELIREYIPEEHRKGFVFHASDQFNGFGQTGSKKFHVEKGREAVRALICIPSIFKIPVICGHVRRDPNMPARIMAEDSSDPKAFIERGVYYHASAFCMCALAAEKYMKLHADTGELAEFRAEENGSSRRLIEEMHSMLKGERDLQQDRDYFEWMNLVMPGWLPMRRVVDEIVFQGKGSLFLQLADACAYILRLFFHDPQRRGNYDEYFQAITGNDLTKLDPQHSQWGTPELGLTQGFRIVI